MAASAFISTLLTIVAGDPAFTTAVAEGDPYPTLESWIALAVVEVHTTRWGILYVNAVAYLAAHMFAMGPGRTTSGGGSAGGAVAERRARNWTLRYRSSGGGSGASTSDSGLTQTTYGLAFLRLRKQTKAPHLATPSLV